MSETLRSLGIPSPTISYEHLREPAAKVVFLGDTSVGKSSVIAFLQNGYTVDKKKQASTIQTIPVGEMTLMVDGGSVRLNFWDTCGQEKFRTLTTTYFRGAHGAVLVYDVTRKETLTHLFESHKSSHGQTVPSWLDQFLDFFKESNSSVTDAHIAVLGNKADIKGNECVEKVKATIDDELKKRGVVDHVFYETSALTGQNLDEFKTLFASKFEEFCTQSVRMQDKVVLQSTDPQPQRKCRC